MRTTPPEKTLLLKAAELAGFSNLTNFIMTAARREANKIISDTHATYVTNQDWALVNTLVANPPKPNKRLKQLLAKKKG